jgi:hypothetical protein
MLTVIVGLEGSGKSNTFRPFLVSVYSVIPTEEFDKSFHLRHAELRKNHRNDTGNDGKFNLM